MQEPGGWGVFGVMHLDVVSSAAGSRWCNTSFGPLFLSVFGCYNAKASIKLEGSAVLGTTWIHTMISIPISIRQFKAAFTYLQLCNCSFSETGKRVKYAEWTICWVLLVKGVGASALSHKLDSALVLTMLLPPSVNAATLPLDTHSNGSLNSSEEDFNKIAKACKYKLVFPCNALKSKKNALEYSLTKWDWKLFYVAISRRLNPLASMDEVSPLCSFFPSWPVDDWPQFDQLIQETQWSYQTWPANIIPHANNFRRAISYFVARIQVRGRNWL